MWQKHLNGSIKLPEHHGKCAEVVNISEWLWKIDPKGKMKIGEARKLFQGVSSHAKQIGNLKVKGKVVLSHGEYKEACNSCNPLLEYFNIKEFKVI